MESDEEKNGEGPEARAEWVEPDPSAIRRVTKEIAEDIFKETEERLLFLLQRLPLAERLDGEWARYQARDPSIRVKNDLLNALIWDALRMTVIDQASFCEWMTTKQGFFGKLLEHRNEFRPPLGSSREEQVWDELFPGGLLSNRTDAIRRAREEFRKKTKPLVTDRNSGFKAHRFDGDNFTEHALKLTQIKAQVEIVKDVPNRYRWMLTDSTKLYELRPIWSTEGTAEDLMDMLIHGSIDNACLEFRVMERGGIWFDQARAPFYVARRETWFQTKGPIPPPSPPDVATPDE